MGDDSAGRARWALLLLAWPSLQLAAYALLGAAFYPWYAAPLHGVLSVFTALGAGVVPRLVKNVGPRSRVGAGVVFLLVSAALIVPGVQYVRAAGRGVPDPKMRQYEAIGAWLGEHADRHGWVAALEMGRLGYYSRRPMFDFVGLVKPPVVEHLRQKDLIWSVKSYRPAYVVAIPPDRWLLEDAWFQSSYAPLRRFVDPEVYSGQPITVFIRVVGDPPAQAPSRIAAHRFGDSIALVGYSVEGPSPGGDGTIGVVLHWRALRSIDRDFTVYLHALDQSGRIVGQADGQPIGGRRSTSRWSPGETVLDPREVKAPSGAAVASLRVGWYLLETMQRLPGVDSAGQPAESATIVLSPTR